VPSEPRMESVTSSDADSLLDRAT